MKKLLIIFAAAAALVACNKAAEPQYVPGKNEVKFTTNLNYYTVKAAVEENVLSDVKVIAGAPINQTVSGTVEGATMTVSPTLYWGIGQASPTTFVAITGGQTSATVTNYTVPTGVDYDYAYCAKLMSASATVNPNEEVTLSFEHIFSKLVINITNNLGADVVSSVVVSNLAHVADINFAAPQSVAIASSDAYDASFPANEYTANSKYELALLPQEAAPTITVTTSLGATYSFVVADSQKFTFQRAKVATVNLTLSGATHAGGSQTQVGNINIGGIADWTADETAVSGTGNTTLSDNYWYIQGTINDSAWGTAFPMTMTATNVWEADFTYNKTGADDEGFKLHLTSGWGSTQIGADPNNKVFTVGDGTTFNWGWKTGNDNIQLSAAGEYHIKYDFTDGDKVYITAN